MNRLVVVLPLVGLAAAGMARAVITTEAPRRDGYRLVEGWPQLPEGFVFGHVPGLDVDAHNHVWVFNRGYRPIVALDGDSGKIVGGFGEGLFLRPHGLRVDREDNLWVTDKDQHLVYKFSHAGKLLLTIGTKGVPGADATHFDGPADVAFAASGEVYVADGYQGSRIAQFSPTGKFIRTWGRKGSAPGEFDVPHGVAVDGEGLVYVADRSNARVQVFDAEGRFLRQWRGPSLGRPWGVTFGRDGFLYVVDGGDGYLTQNKADPNPSGPDRAGVMRMDRQGRILDRWGSFGRYAGQFVWPHSVAVGRDGAVYVSEVHTGMRVQKFVRREGRRESEAR